MRTLTESQRQARADRKAVRRAKRKRTFASVGKVIKRLVQAAELMFPDTGSGALKHAFVTEAVKHVKTPAGDKLETTVLNYLIELAVDAL